MTPDPPPSGPPGSRSDPSGSSADDDRSTGEEAAQILSEVMEDQRQKKARRESASGRKPKDDGNKTIIAAGMAVVFAILLVARPSFLMPEPVPEPARDLVEAGLRMEMYRAAVQIQRFRENAGELPDDLEQVLEDPETDLRYTRVDRSFYLVGDRAGVEIVYRSDEALDSLLADAPQVIRQGSRGAPGPGSGGER